MRYFSVSEIILSCVVFAIYGIVMGSLYFIMFSNKRRAFKIPLCIIYVIKSRSFSPNVSLKIGTFKRISTKILSSLYEFFLLTAKGVIYIFLIYVCCDGVFRTYTLIISLLLSVASYKLMNKAFGKAVKTALDKIYYAEYCVIYIVLYPIRYLIRLIIKKTAPILRFAIKKLRQKTFKRLSNKKYKEQALILKHLLINPKKTEG